MNIYVACPANIVTGGVELLHQLVYELNTYNNINAYIYYTSNSIDINSPHPDDYKKYNNPYTTKLSFKNYDDTIIVPEIYIKNLFTDLLKPFRKIIYWESVDNYYRHIPRNLKFVMPDNTIHMAQSYYAMDFLYNTVKINKDDIIYVTDYINDEYLINTNIINKKKQVLYNPAKGMSFTRKIIELSDNNIIYIPIENMNREQVKNLMRESMLYIDFGDHPGKDRMPREACISGCCIITGRDGSANYKKDICINDEYKFDRNIDNLFLIIDKINYILNNYEECNKDFIDYRDQIRNEYSLFRSNISELVRKIS